MCRFACARANRHVLVLDQVSLRAILGEWVLDVASMVRTS
jgi:hypothetical protein